MHVSRAIAAGFALVVAWTAASNVASANPKPLPATALDTPRFVRAGDLDTDVVVHYTMKPSKYRGEADPGPFVGTGLLAIRSGPERDDTIFPFSALGVTPPNIEQIVPDASHDACSANGPIAIVALAGSVAPAVVFTTGAIGKGYLPIVHVLLPIDGSSHRYRIVRVYASPMNAPDESQGAPARTIHVERVRDLMLPERCTSFPKAARNAHVAVVDGRDAAGHAVTIALDFHAVRDGAVRPGASIVIRDAPNGFEGTEGAVP
jgi:hypothetical protein